MRTNIINLITLTIMILLVASVYAPPAPAAGQSVSTGGGEGVDDWDEMSKEDKMGLAQSNPSALSEQQFQEAWGYMGPSEKINFVNTASDTDLQASWDNIPYEDQVALLRHPSTDANAINKLSDSQAEEFISSVDWDSEPGLTRAMESYIGANVGSGDALFNDPDLEESFQDYFSDSGRLLDSDYAAEFLDSRAEGSINFVMPESDFDSAQDVVYDPDTDTLTVNGNALDLTSLGTEYNGATVDIFETSEAADDDSIVIEITIGDETSISGELSHDFTITSADGSPIQLGGSDAGAITLVDTQFGGDFAFSLYPTDDPFSLGSDDDAPMVGEEDWRDDVLPSISDTSGLSTFDDGRAYTINEETGRVEWYDPNTGQFLGQTGSLAENPPAAASTVEIINTGGDIALDADGILIFDENGGAEVVFTQGYSEVIVSSDEEPEEESSVGDIIPSGTGDPYVVTGEGVGDISTLTEEEIQALIDSGDIEEADTTGMPEDGCPSGQYWNAYLGMCTSSGASTSGYSSFEWGTSGYDASGRQNIEDGNVNIQNRNGDVSVTPSVITAEDATLTIDNEVVSGSFIVTRDPISGTIESMTVMPPASGRAIIQNDDADIDIRFDQSSGSGSASVTVDYDSSGNMNKITAIGSDGSEIEVYFGPELTNTERTYYVRGEQFTIDLVELQQMVAASKETQGIFTNPITGFTIGDFDVNKSLYVSNVTLKSSDALFRYLPAKYEVKSSRYGTFEEKIICFINCSNINIDNSVYVRDDNQGVISIGTMGSIVIDYEGNSREVFDLNSLLLTKDSNLEFTSNFNTLVANSITGSAEDDLLFRLNRESKRNLSVRESLELQSELYYQNAAPASFTDLNEKVSYIDNDEGYIDLNLFTYVMDGKRKLVLNRFSYNNMIELNSIETMPVDIPVITNVVVDNDITYFLEDDLSLQPNVYDNWIYFKPPDDVKQDYGELIAT